MAFLSDIEAIHRQIQRRLRRLHNVVLNLLGQREDLQHEVLTLREIIANGGALQQVENNDRDQNGNIAQGNGSAPVLITDHQDDDSAEMRKFKDLLYEEYPQSLGPHEMLRLALFSKLETEIERRQNERAKGKLNSCSL